MKNKKLILVFILLLIIACLLTIFLYLIKNYTINGVDQANDSFAKYKINELMNDFKAEIFALDTIKNDDFIVIAYKHSLTDSNWILLYDFQFNKTYYGFWKEICKNNNILINKIFNLSVKVEKEREKQFRKFTLLRALNIIPNGLTDGDVFYIMYKKRKMIFESPSSGISPFDIYLSKFMIQ